MSRRARIPARRAWSLALLCLASFVAVVDTTILSVALPSVRRAMGFSPAGVQWVLNAYALVFGGMLLLFGRLADLHGRRRLFLTGLAVFGAGSVVAGLAWDQASLIGGRVLQGAGAAAFVPASLALLTATFREPAERSRAVGAYGALAGAGFVVGMVGIAWLYVLTLFLQEVLGHGPLRTGLLFAPMTGAAVVAAACAGAVVSRAGVRAAALAGLCGVALGLALMLAGLAPDRPPWAVIGGMVVGEAGFMLANVALTVAGTGAVGDERSGLAAGLLNTSMQLGGGWGLGVASAVVGAALAAGGTGPAGYAAALRWGLVSCLAFAALGLAVVGVGLRPRTAVGPARPRLRGGAGPSPGVRRRR